MTAKLKIAGAWSGVLEVELETWTVSMLRGEVARRSDLGAESINLIFAGKLLKDGDGTEKLIELGFKNNGKVLATRVSLDQGKELINEKEKNFRFSRIKAAAASLAKRHADGYLPVEDFNLELENQSGQKVQLGSETDQRALMMGLVLHKKAKQLLKREQYVDALEVLNMGEEAFALCDSKLIEMIDNVPILQLDIVWCYFMLQDISWLSVAGKRLEKARRGIEHAHGEASSRVRLLQGGLNPEVALHTRMELLEGVVAYHSGQLEKSKKALTSAQLRYSQLQVSDETLSLLVAMGYEERDAKRALRMSNQDVPRAVDFLVQEKARAAQKIEEDIRRRKEIMEQKRFGITALGKAVDLKRLKELVSVGFEKEIAAESLRRNENDTQKALDDLTNPETNSDIQLYIESRKRKRLHHAADGAIAELTSMGFPRETVVAAVRAYGTRDEALNQLLEHGGQNLPLPAEDDAHFPGSVPNNIGSIGSSGAGDGVVGHQALGAETSNGATSGLSEIEARDIEMEDELTEDLQDQDAFSDYDFELTKEGEAIDKYLALLDAADEKIEEVTLPA